MDQVPINHHVKECLPPADVPPIGEVGPEKRLHDCILNTLLVGQPDEPVGIHCVRRPLHLGEVEVDAFRFSGGGDLGVKFQRALPASELADAIVPAGDAFLNWAVGYVIDGNFMLQEDALESIYYRSYKEHFAAHPEDLEELIHLAKNLRNPHAEATTGVDLQVPAIMTYLGRHGLQLQGTEVVDIGSWKKQASHPISIRLSPLHIHVVGDSKMTLEQFWQEKKCLAVWKDE